MCWEGGCGDGGRAGDVGTELGVISNTLDHGSCDENVRVIIYSVVAELNEPRHEKTCASAQSDQRLCNSLPG